MLHCFVIILDECSNYFKESWPRRVESRASLSPMDRSLSQSLSLNRPLLSQPPLYRKPPMLLPSPLLWPHLYNLR